MHRVLVRAGVLVSGIFTVLFIYEYFGGSIFPVLWTFGALHLGVVFATPISTRLLRTLGTRTLIILAMPCIIAGLAPLYAIAQTGNVLGLSAVWGLVIFVLCNIAYRSLYWVPYLVDLSELLDRSRRGFQLAILQNAADVNVAAMPFWGGLIVGFFGFGWLFLFAVLFIVAGILPLMWVSNRYEMYSWGYTRTFRELFASRNRPILFAYMGVGIQAVAQYTVWPLLVFLILDKEFIVFGAVTALTFFIILLLRFFAGR